MNPIRAIEEREFAYERPSIVLGVVILTVYYILGMAHAQALAPGRAWAWAMPRM